MARFTLLDGVYYDAILRVRDAFVERELPFCLVGGGAAQVWITHLISGDGERRISAEASLPTMLRKTRDADFSTRCDSSEALAMLDELASESAGAAHVLGPRLLRLGPVQIALTLEPGDLSGMADRYDRLLDSRKTVQMRRGRTPDAIPVISLSALIATKMTRRGDKAKDLVDVGNLLAAARRSGARLDADAVRGYLEGDAMAEQLLGELMAGEDD